MTDLQSPMRCVAGVTSHKSICMTAETNPNTKWLCDTDGELISNVDQIISKPRPGTLSSEAEPGSRNLSRMIMKVGVVHASMYQISITCFLLQINFFFVKKCEACRMALWCPEVVGSQEEFGEFFVMVTHSSKFRMALAHEWRKGLNAAPDCNVNQK
jgi:hypothetical protein